MSLDDPVCQLAFVLAHDLDPVPGRSRLISFGSADLDGESGEGMPDTYTDVSPALERSQTDDAVPGHTPQPDAKPANREGVEMEVHRGTATTDPTGAPTPGDLEELVERLTSLEVPPLPHELLLNALRASVDSAAYWQGARRH